jgi:hypothetical protein
MRLSPFDQDRLNVMVVLKPEGGGGEGSPYMMIRTVHNAVHYWSTRGVHELVISREGSSLVLKRWSSSTRSSKLWAVLYFITWEEMVLFYCTFVALKFRSLLSDALHPGEFKLGLEKRLFQA